MTITTQQRPLPAGIVGIAHIERGPRQDQRSGTPSGTLLVGHGIQIKGEIESCQTLTVEGRVEAALDAKSLQVLDGGVFKGRAQVDKAEIAGSFDGTLTVRGQLSIKSSGRVSGKIRYDRIIIEGGGELSGDVGSQSETGVKTPSEPVPQTGPASSKPLPHRLSLR